MRQPDRPLPSEETTPPVMKIYRAMGVGPYGRIAVCGKRKNQISRNKMAELLSERDGRCGFVAGRRRGRRAGACWSRSYPLERLFLGQRRVDGGRIRVLTPAMAASAIDRKMNRPPRIEVARVRKSAAPRAVISPPDDPPTPSPPPSDRCMRITATSDGGNQRLDDRAGR